MWVTLLRDRHQDTIRRLKSSLRTTQPLVERPDPGHSKEQIVAVWRQVETHDASFQTIDEHKPSMQLASAVRELNFVDSYKYNIAAYHLAELLGIDDMLPVYVERNWKGDTGSLSWWLPVKMDEVDRHKQNLTAPDADAWNNQMYKIRVLDQLVYDNDPNLTNVLIGENWKIWRVDFTRIPDL